MKSTVFTAYQMCGWIETANQKQCYIVSGTGVKPANQNQCYKGPYSSIFSVSSAGRQSNNAGGSSGSNSPPNWSSLKQNTYS